MNETIRGFLIGYLVEHGLFRAQAQEVLARIEADPNQESMRDRWDDAVEDHLRPLLPALMVTADEAAVAWIDEKAPQHWARPFFAKHLPAAAPTPGDVDV